MAVFILKQTNSPRRVALMTSREGPRGDEDSRPLKVSGEGVVGAKTLYPVNDRRPCYFNFNLVDKKKS